MRLCSIPAPQLLMFPQQWHERLLTSLDQERSLRDFYPACGRFNIETWSIPINVGSRTFWVRVGALPGEFGKLIKIFGINVILGSEILNESRAVLDFVAGEIFFDEDSHSGSARPH